MSRTPGAESPFAVLRGRNFRLYFSGQAISLIGTWMQIVAQSYVVVHLSKLNASLGLIQVASSVPMILLSLRGGAFADRADRRKILIATQFALMGLAFGFAAIIHWGAPGLTTIMAIAFLSGVAAAFDLPASQAFTPQLVEPRHIPQAVALMQAIFHGSRLIGPALAGVLMAAFGAEAVFLANGLSFIAVIATLMWIKPAERPKRPSGDGAAVAEGLRYLKSRPDVRALMAITALGSVLIFPFMVVLGAGFAKQFYGGDPTALGVMMAGSGAGALLGALGLLGIADEAARLRRIVICTLGLGVSMLAYSLSRQLAMTVLCISAMTFCVSTSLGLVSTIMQQTVPDHLRGRVMSINTLLFTGLMPFSALALGALSDQVGLPTVMQAAAGLHFLVSVLVLHNAVAARRMVSSEG